MEIFYNNELKQYKFKVKIYFFLLDVCDYDRNNNFRVFRRSFLGKL